MTYSLPPKELKKYIESQIKIFIPDEKIKTGMFLDDDIEEALDKCDFCFKHIKNSAFVDQKGETFFSHLHADQYGMFLVYFGSIIWNKRQDKIICDRIMYVNRVLHSFMMSYKAKVPNIFWLAHPIGSVIGNADYSDYLYISQNCTVNTGSNAEELKPHIGKFFSMGAGAALIGDEPIGNNCSIGVNALLFNQALKDNSIVINKNGKTEILENRTTSFARKMFYVSERCEE